MARRKKSAKKPAGRSVKARKPSFSAAGKSYVRSTPAAVAPSDDISSFALFLLLAVGTVAIAFMLYYK
ncbi:MAG: hypothetical protein WC488_00265 [Candidatus Micrarchaeia archaeon]